jgi:hypothetical protein
MSNARYYHKALLLTDGTVLVTGGERSSPITSAELYDFSTGTWTTTINMNVARCGHGANILTDGKVLVSGGNGISNAVNSAELY